MCQAQNKDSINSTQYYLLLLLSSQTIRGAMQEKQGWHGRALNAKHRAENFTRSWYSIALTAQWNRDYDCTHFIDGTKVQRSQSFAWGHTASEYSRAGVLEVQESGIRTHLWWSTHCADSSHCPRHLHHSTNLWHHNLYLWTLQGRGIMEESKIQAWSQNARFKCQLATS